jgi:hypothetical protein
MRSSKHVRTCGRERLREGVVVDDALDAPAHGLGGLGVCDFYVFVYVG